MTLSDKSDFERFWAFLVIAAWASRYKPERLAERLQAGDDPDAMGFEWLGRIAHGTAEEIRSARTTGKVYADLLLAAMQ